MIDTSKAEAALDAREAAQDNVQECINKCLEDLEAMINV